MKYLSKFLLMITILFGTHIFADDVWFISPQYGQTISNTMTIKIQPPYYNKKVRVRIKKEYGFARTVWRGTLSPQNNYTILVNTSKFPPGPYEIEAKYYIGFEDFDGSIDVWIGDHMPHQGQYFPD
ncbi:MAG: hypothetical protein ACRCVW_04005 [Brevinema sp.]